MSSSINIPMTVPARTWASRCRVGRLPTAQADPEAPGRSRHAGRIIDEMQTKLEGIGHKDYSYATVRRFEPDRPTRARRSPRSASSRDDRKHWRRRSRRYSKSSIRAEPRWCTTRWARKTWNALCAIRTRRSPATAASASSASGMPHPRSYGTNARVLAAIRPREECPDAGRRDPAHDVFAGANIRFAGARLAPRRYGRRPRALRSATVQDKATLQIRISTPKDSTS